MIPRDILAADQGVETRPVDGYTLELAARLCAEVEEGYREDAERAAGRQDYQRAVTSMNHALGAAECADAMRAAAPPSSSPAVPQEGGTPIPGLALAIRFHETYERLAPSFGYETRTETRQFDPTTPNGKLMIAVCAAVLVGYEQEADRLTAQALASEAARRGLEKNDARYRLLRSRMGASDGMTVMVYVASEPTGTFDEPKASELDSILDTALGRAPNGGET